MFSFFRRQKAPSEEQKKKEEKDPGSRPSPATSLKRKDDKKRDKTSKERENCAVEVVPKENSNKLNNLSALEDEAKLVELGRGKNHARFNSLQNNSVSLTAINGDFKSIDSLIDVNGEASRPAAVSLIQNWWTTSVNSSSPSLNQNIKDSKDVVKTVENQINDGLKSTKEFKKPEEISSKNDSSKTNEYCVKDNTVAAKISLAVLDTANNSVNVLTNKNEHLNATPTPVTVSGESDHSAEAAKITTLEINEPRIAVLEGKITEYQKQKDNWEAERRNLVNQETKFKAELSDLGGQLSARDGELNQLKVQMDELQRDVLVKTWGMDRLQAELASAHKESELVRHKLKKLEDDLNGFKEKNMELADEILKKSEEANALEEENKNTIQELEDNIQTMQIKLKDIEEKLAKVQEERNSLEMQKLEMEEEREEEMRIVQEALEEAQVEKTMIQLQFEKDFEKLRTVNTDREQQLLDDFEWKLREVEQACKKRLEEKDKNAEERVKSVRKELEDKVKDADKQLKEAEKLRSFEAEVIQLRGLTHEQQRTMRQSARQIEDLQVSEKILKEEISRLKSAIEKEKSHLYDILNLHEKQLADKERRLQTRLEQQRMEISAQWEERLKQDCCRLQSELDQMHSEDKRLAIEALRLQKEKEIKTNKEVNEEKIKNLIKEITNLKEKIDKHDIQHQNELERLQTNADRDILELRRKLDKLDMSYQEQIEKLLENHEKDIEQLSEENKHKVQTMEQSYQHQLSSTRTTIELVKEQMDRDAQMKLEDLERKHQDQLEAQWNQMVREKEQVVLLLEEKQRSQMEKFKFDLENSHKNRNSRELELLDTITSLRKQLQGQTTVINDLQGNVEVLQGGLQVLNQEMSNQGQEMLKVQNQANHRLREREALIEVEFQKKISDVTKSYESQIEDLRNQLQCITDEYEVKVCYLNNVLDESKLEKNSESHPADVELITELQNVIESRDKELAKLREEKRFYLLQLMQRERSKNISLQSHQDVGKMNCKEQWRKGGGQNSFWLHNSPPKYRTISFPNSNSVNDLHSESKIGNLERSSSVEFPHITRISIRQSSVPPFATTAD